MTHHHHIEHAIVFVGKLVLAQLTQTFAFIQRNLTRALLQIATKNFHESGFTATVRADQAVAVALAETHGNIFKKRLGAELHGDIDSR